MPREQINYPDMTQKERALMQRSNGSLGFSDTDPAPCDYEPWNEPALHVSWHADDREGNSDTGMAPGHVQVAFEADIDYLKFAIDNPNGSRPERTLVWTDTLSAGEIDRMILTLKKAKRKAFPQGS